MTTQDDIVFFCIFCSQKIAIQSPKGGFTVECPACRRRIPVPRRKDIGPATASHFFANAAETDKSQNGSANGVKKLFIPKGASLTGSAPHSPSATVTIPPPAPGDDSSSSPDDIPPYKDLSLFVLGCVCLVLGVLLAHLLPRAIFVHASLFLTTLVAALLCIARRRVTSGAALLLATVFAVQLVEVPLVAPLLLQFVPQPAAVQPHVQTAGPAAKRLIIDQNGAQTLVPAGREDISEAPDHYRPESEPPASVTPPREEPAATPAAPKTPEAPAPKAEELPTVAKPEPSAAPEPAIAETPKPETAPVTAPVEPTSARPEAAPAPLVFTPKPTLPLVVYSDCSVDSSFYPSGWMGYIDAIDLDDCWEDNPHSGKTCFRMAFNATYYWGGVAWQSPPNDWGDEPGGYDLSDATELTFWARAEHDGTMAEFKVGIHSSAHFADTANVTTGKKKLTTKWKQFKIPLKGQDLSRVISGFVCVVEGTDIPPIIYLDDIEYH